MATPAGSSPKRSARWAPRSSDLDAGTIRVVAHTSRRSASASRASPGPARTSSPLERHGARTLPGLREPSFNAFSASSPPSHSTTTRPSEPRTRQLLRLTPWNQPLGVIRSRLPYHGDHASGAFRGALVLPRPPHGPAVSHQGIGDPPIASPVQLQLGLPIATVGG